MASRCLELGAYKMARDQARSKVYTPPELRRVEERICSKHSSDSSYRCTNGRIVDCKADKSSPRTAIKRKSR